MEMIKLLTEVFEQGRVKLVAAPAQARGESNGAQALAFACTAAAGNAVRTGSGESLFLLVACEMAAEPQWRAGESLEADNRAWRHWLTERLAWTMDRRMHRALGRAYPSNDIGPRK